MTSADRSTTREVAVRLAARWATAARPFSRDRTAARLDVRLVTHSFVGPTRGVAVAGDTIFLDARLQGAQRDFVFAHEVAHVLLQRSDARVRPEHVEFFADVFARELLVPREWLEGLVDARHFARRLRVSHELLAVQLSAAGRVPPVQRLGRRVLCADCGWDRHRPPCACDAWRGESETTRRQLPDAYDHAVWRSAHRHLDMQLLLSFDEDPCLPPSGQSVDCEPTCSPT